MPRRLLPPLFASLLLLAPLGGASAQDASFHIKAYSFSGNNLISDTELLETTAPYTGNAKVFGDIQKALEAVESLYKKKGYSGIQISLPEQEMGDGKVRMEVIETAIGKITVTGNQHFDQDNILSTLPSLRIGQTPNANKLSENIQLANENPSKQVDVVLKIGDKDSELDARVEVKDYSPISLRISADNTGNAQTGKDRLGIAIQHANLFNKDHVATGSYSTSLERPDRTKIYSLSYRLPLYQWGDSMDFIIGHSDVSSGSSATVAGPLQFSGSGRVYGIRYNHILPRQGVYTHRFVYGLDQREYDNTCTIAGSALCGAGGADVTVRPFSILYNGQWNAPGNTTQLFGSLATNIPGGPHGEQSDFTASRPGATENYTVLRAGISSGLALAGDWLLRGALNAQYTNDALVSGEQFGLVGSSAVRGFKERVIAADKGYYGSIETYTPELAGGMITGSLRLLAFYDFGSGSFNKVPPGLTAKDTVSSAGLGVRYNLDRQASLRFDTAHVINGGPEGTAQAGSWRGHVNFSMGF